jgi:O-antigen/teichoic acid export membrane protein
VLYSFVGWIICSTIFLVFLSFWQSFYTKTSPETLAFFVYAVPYALLLLWLLVVESYARIHLRIAIPNFFREVILRVGIVILVILFSQKIIGFEMLVGVRVSLYGLMALFGVLYVYQLGIFFWKNPSIIISGIIFEKKNNSENLTENKNQTLFGKIIQYGLWIWIGGAGTLIIVKIDTLMIPALLNTEALGIYTIAYFIGSLLEVPRKAISQIATPLVSKAWSENNLSQVETLYQKSALNQTIAGTLLFLGIWVNLDSLFLLMPNGVLYAQGKYVVFWIALLRWLDMFFGINSELLLQSKHYRMNLFFILALAVLMLFSNYIGILKMGIVGAGFATCMSFLLFNIIKYIYIWQKFHIHAWQKEIFFVTFWGILTYLLVLILPFFEEKTTFYILSNIILKSAFISVFFLSGVLFFGWSKDINEIIKKMVGVKRNN